MDPALTEWLKIADVVLIASVKFAISPFVAESQGFNFFESVLITTSGGLLGVLIFTFAGDAIVYGWKNFMSLIRKGDVKPKKIHTWTNRTIVRARKRFGLMGIALLTPSVLSIPVGTFIIQGIYKGRLKNILGLFIAILVWSLGLNLFAQFLSLSQFF